MKQQEISDLKARALIASIIDGTLDVEVANCALSGQRSHGRKAHSTPPGQQACPEAWRGIMHALRNCAERIEREQARAVREVARMEALGSVVETVGGKPVEIPSPRGEWEDLRVRT